MTDRIRVIKHEAVPDCGSFEVRYPDGRPSQYFYWDDIPARRLRPETLDRETALDKEGGSKGRQREPAALILLTIKRPGMKLAFIKPLNVSATLFYSLE
jgi:hypothetical protein